MVFYWLNFKKRRKATLWTSKIILEVRRVAFFTFLKVHSKHSISKKPFYLLCTMQKYHNVKKATLRSSKIILEDRRVAFLPLFIVNIYAVSGL